MSGLCVVLVTCQTDQEAQSIAKSLVEQRLAACVNIIPAVQSHYRWEGKVQHASEFMLMIKTQTKHFKALQQAVKDKHSYDCPEIIQLPIQEGSQAYLDWIKSNT